MEMDTNFQIIQLVQNRPVLYTKCNDFRGRTEQWKEVAGILKVDVLWVKSRWHILRAKFLKEYASELKGKPTTFKYFNDLSFLIDHINVPAFEMHLKQDEENIHPEFVITKKDLEETSDDDSTTIFMELDLDESANDLAAEISEGELEETFYVPNEEFSEQRAQTTKPPKYKTEPDSQVATFRIVELSEKKETPTVEVNESTKEVESNADEPNDEVAEPSLPQSEPVEKPQESEEVVNNSQLDESKSCGSGNPEKHRCEDTIFGELVTATLQKMPSDKKKAVKREIMNILFT